MIILREEVSGRKNPLTSFFYLVSSGEQKYLEYITYWQFVKIKFGEQKDLDSLPPQNGQLPPQPLPEQLPQ